MKNKIGYVLTGIIGGLVSAGTFSYLQNDQLSEQLLVEQLRNQHLSEARASSVAYTMPTEATIDFRNAAQRTVNAVVHVKTTFEMDGGYYSFDPIRHFFFGSGMQQRPPRMGAGAGSGVVISEDGYIATNNHVIDGASNIQVTLNDNVTYDAEVVGTDPSTDLALLKIEAADLPKIEFGNSDEVEVGEWVLAVGNPFNLESTVTAGIVSAKGRDINILGNGPEGASAVEAFIQTDAAVNPGNSGGALVNTRGELIGINAAIKSNTGSYTGYSFAIPVNIVTKVIEDLLKYGAVQRGYLGVRIQNVDQNLTEMEGLQTSSGVFVASTLDMGAAKEAGIEEGDVITQVGDKVVKTVSELQEQLSRYRPGDRVLIEVVRGEKTLSIPLVLRNKFGDEELTPKKTLQIHEKLNAQFSELSQEDLERFAIDSGVKISELGPGKLMSAGISKGFIILKVDDKKITTEQDLIGVLESKKGGVLIEGIYPNGKRAYYGFGL